jgi:hypothetical protein
MCLKDSNRLYHPAIQNAPSITPIAHKSATPLIKSNVHNAVPTTHRNSKPGENCFIILVLVS